MDDNTTQQPSTLAKVSDGLYAGALFCLGTLVFINAVAYVGRIIYSPPKQQD